MVLRMQCTIALLMLPLLSGGAFDTKRVSTPPAGCQFLINSGFNACGPRGCNPAPAKSNQPSAALGWIIHSDNQNRPVTNRLLPAAGGCDDGGKMLRIRCQGNESGVYQIFNPRVKRIKVTACVRVWKGNVMLFVARNGFANENVSTGPTNGWRRLVLETNGAVLNNWVGIYNQDMKEGEFAIDHVCIEPF